MTQTTPSHTHSQAVEAAVQRLMNLVADYGHHCGSESYHQRADKDAMAADSRREAEAKREEIENALRAELASQQEVAAPVGGEAFQFAVAVLAKSHGVKYLDDGRYMFTPSQLLAFSTELAASRVPVASLASREQGVEAVGVVPVTYEAVNRALAVARELGAELCARGMKAALEDFARTAPPSSKTQDDLAGAETSYGIAHSLGGFKGGFMSEHGRQPTEQEIWNHAIRSWRDLNPSQPKAPAPVPVVQGEATEPMRRHVEDFARRHGWTPESGEGAFECAQRLCYAQGREDATPPMAVGAVGGVGARPVWQIKQNPLWSSLWMDASQDEFDRATGEKRIMYATPAPEQATTGSGQDSERLDFLLNSPSRYAERSPSGMWRVYEDKAPANATAADWRAMSTRYERNGREAIDAAILSTASPAGEVKS